MRDGSQRLATTAAVWACWAVSSTMHNSIAWATSSGVRSKARTDNTTGAPRLTAMRALTLSSVGVATSVKSEPMITTASQREATAW